MAGVEEVVGDENESAGQSLIHCVKGIILWVSGSHQMWLARLQNGHMAASKGWKWVEILEQKWLGKKLLRKDEEKLVKQVKKTSLGGIDST